MFCSRDGGEVGAVCGRWEGAREYKQGLRQVVPATLKLNHVMNK